MKVGVQLFTVNQHCKDLDSFSETLKKIADIGYTVVQVSGTCDYEGEWLKEQLDKVLHTLSPREEMVIKLRFGFDDGRPRTLEEVGSEFNITRERIRQIEAKALRKLRHQSRSKVLRGFLSDN